MAKQDINSNEVLASRLSSLEGRVRSDTELNRQEHGALGGKIDSIQDDITELKISNAESKLQFAISVKIIERVGIWIRWGVGLMIPFAVAIIGSIHWDRLFS